VIRFEWLPVSCAPQPETEVTLTVTGSLLVLAALCFPFSVVATNLLLALALAAGLMSGLLWQGARELWSQHRALANWMLAYFTLLVLGVLWSLNPGLGVRVVSHYWFWFVLPLMLAVMRQKKWQVRFLVSLSVGLTANLVLCVLQRLGYYVVESGGSWMESATGHIGHISFGLIYGIWASWLLHWGWQRYGGWRWLAWGLACWSWIMIFAAQGRAGYVVAVLLMLVVVIKHAGFSLRVWSVLALAVVMLGLVTVSSDAGKARMQDTLEKIEGVVSGDVQTADPRWSFWLIALEAWKQHPVLGVGTGGFSDSSAMVYQQHPELIYPGLEKYPPAHPHNMYVLSLTRWSVIGVVVLLGWLVSWLRLGTQLVLQEKALSMLVPLSGIALLVDAVFSITLEQHFSGIFLAMVLGLGLAGSQENGGRSNREEI